MSTIKPERPNLDLDSLISDAVNTQQDHLPRELFFGYPIEPDEEDVHPDYQETCLCGDPFPCREARLADAVLALIHAAHPGWTT